MLFITLNKYLKSNIKKKNNNYKIYILIDYRIYIIYIYVCINIKIFMEICWKKNLIYLIYF